MYNKHIRLLEEAWSQENKDYGLMLHLLFECGYYPDFPANSEYLNLWVLVKTGHLIGEDVSDLEYSLNQEIEQLRVSNNESDHQLQYAFSYDLWPTTVSDRYPLRRIKIFST